MLEKKRNEGMFLKFLLRIVLLSIIRHWKTLTISKLLCQMERNINANLKFCCKFHIPSS